ncbi:MAG: MFS transporter [Chloroflexi bacterium]|nr:MFS transporter [Chloroflexota bacterium]
MATTALGVTPSPLAIFRNRNFTLLWSGQLVSTIGSSLTSLAASILVYRLTNSAMSVGLMLMATAAPSLILGLIAGVFVDRIDRKRIMIAADLIRAGLVFSIPFLVPLNILWLYIIVMLSSCVSTFFDPAHASVLPEVATDEELAAANSLMAISAFGSTAVGFAASGLIASQFPIAWAFYIDALTFLISALCIAFVGIRTIKPEGKTNVATVFRNMRSGISFLMHTPVLRSIFVLAPFIGISFGMWNSLLLPFARQALGANEFEYGLQEGLTSVGFVLSSLLMARLSSRLREGQWLVISYLGMGLVGIIYASLSSIWLAIAMVMISGFMNAPASIARNLIVQRNTPRETRGRVASVFFVTRDISFLVGMAAAGLADVWGVRVMMVASALLVLVPGALALVLPGLGQPAAEWRRMVHLLRTAPSPKLGAGRAATLADFDLLIGKLPVLSNLSQKQRRAVIGQSCVIDVPAGATIVCCGEKADDVYFILSGRAIAGIEENGNYRSLETMRAGDFFGEIAALMNTPRTANVVADDATTLLQVPATAFRQLMQNPKLSQLVHMKFFERMSRTSLGDLPRFATLDQSALKELRTQSGG